MSNLTMTAPEYCDTEQVVEMFDTVVFLIVEWATGLSSLVTVTSRDGAMWVEGVTAGVMFSPEADHE